jgi:iron complex transport system ATP-binding protein
MLQALDISFAYGESDRLVLDRASLGASRGEILGLLGPNGSGKTTLLKILAGMLRPRSGRVLLDGAPLNQYSRRALARRIAYVPQETHIAFDFSVLDIVLMGRFPHLGTFALEGPADLHIARHALAATDTAQFEARAFATLSGGEKQRVVIAAALAQSADLLLLDEPTASLDLGYQVEITSLLRRLNQEHGTTFVVCTHDLNMAAALCSRVVMLQRGRVLADGPTADTLTAANIRDAYGVDADVHFHSRAGHLTVVPLGRAS